MVEAMRKATVSILLLGLLTALWASPPAGAARRWSLYRNKKYGFQFVLLKDWQISDTRSHPAILVAAYHPSKAQARLAASVLPTRVTLLSFARDEIKVLKKIGLKVGDPMPFQTGRLKGLWARGVHPTKPYSFRVYFFSRKRAYFAFTFTYPTKKYREVMKAFQIMLLTFQFTK